MKLNGKVWRYIALGLLFVVLYFAGEEVPKETIRQELSNASVVRAVDGVSEDESEYYVVKKVIDGDTIRVARGGVEETVRLIGVDTPETVDPRRPVQCFGKEASEFARNTLLGNVTLESDPSQDVRDKYGRLLAYVYLADGTLFNKLLIENGYAHEYTYRVPYRLQQDFRTAEQTARSRGAGLWASNVCGENIASLAPRAKVTAITPTAPTPTGVYRCDKNTYNCTDFKTQKEALAVFAQCGGSANDIHKLDSDKDGIVCESLK